MRAPDTTGDVPNGSHYRDSRYIGKSDVVKAIWGCKGGKDVTGKSDVVE